MATIPAQPYPFSFDPARAALVIIDMQRDFLEPGGFGAALGNDVNRLAYIVPNVAKLLQTFRRKELTIVHTKECHQPGRLPSRQTQSRPRRAENRRPGPYGTNPH
jgi:nicotinamidase-related amidase